VKSVAAEVYGTHFGSISHYVDLLASRGIERGLIGPREFDRLWDRHVLNSAALAELIPAAASVADVGSGAGLPGIPLAILRPDLQVTLIEPLLRRATFLSEVVAELGLAPRVTVARVRAEDHVGKFRTVTARAVAPLGRLIDWCDPLRSPNGTMLALKGRSAADEVEAAESVLRRRRLRVEILTVQAHPAAELTTVVRVGAWGDGC
jgi:16S rRNA (guanine527-N7)-methyltransferase